MKPITQQELLKQHPSPDEGLDIKSIEIPMGETIANRPVDMSQLMTHALGSLGEKKERGYSDVAELVDSIQYLTSTFGGKVSIGTSAKLTVQAVIVAHVSVAGNYALDGLYRVQYGLANEKCRIYITQRGEVVSVLEGETAEEAATKLATWAAAALEVTPNPNDL